jgi:hypothetical protein
MYAISALVYCDMHRGDERGGSVSWHFMPMSIHLNNTWIRASDVVLQVGKHSLALCAQRSITKKAKANDDER